MKYLPMRLSLGVSCALVCACSRAAAPARVQSGGATKPSVALLVDLVSEHEANAVAVIKQGEWRFPDVADTELLKQLARTREYVLLPSLSSEPTATGRGALTGSMREDCGDYFLQLAKPPPALVFAVLNTLAPAQPVPVARVGVESQHVAAVAQLLERVGHVKLAPTIERAYRVDLDGDEKPELILQATHPELAGDPPEYKPEFYSLLVVLAADATVAPAYWGYMQASEDLSGFRVLALDAVADVDLDGKRELLVRIRHAEGWQTRAFHFSPDKGLTELFNSVGGERDCPEPAE
jgi:hypothetical protein